MAIKFEDKPSDGDKKGAADLKARFATRIEADNPVNPDAGAEEAFTPKPAAERATPKRTKGKR